ncbi:MAG: 50S ribosomal protein L18 [Myxococcales bacterium]|nr:50S ribosomal protein L18 [Myxococcales bacterium]
MLTPRFSNRRQHRKYRLRFSIRGTTDRPRLSVFRSAKHIYAQVIDDDSGRTLAQASTLEEGFKAFDGDKTAAANKVGELVADRAIAAGVSKLVFDRNGFKYTGRIAAVSKAAHAKGLLTKDGHAPAGDNGDAAASLANQE